MQKESAALVILMIIIGAGVILSNTITPWVGEVNRALAVRDLIHEIVTAVNYHVTLEHNKLGDIILDTFQKNRDFGKSEHDNQTQKLDQVITDLREIKQMLKNGSA